MWPLLFRNLLFLFSPCITKQILWESIEDGTGKIENTLLLGSGLDTADWEAIHFSFLWEDQGTILQQLGLFFKQTKSSFRKLVLLFLPLWSSNNNLEVKKMKSSAWWFHRGTIDHQLLDTNKERLLNQNASSSLYLNFKRTQIK